MKTNLPTPFEPKPEFIYDTDFDRAVRWDADVQPAISTLPEDEQEKWELLLDDQVTGSYSGLLRGFHAEADAWLAAVEGYSRDKWKDLVRVDGSISRSTYWATTCGEGAYQYHHNDPPIQPYRLDGELWGVVKAALAKCGIAPRPDTCIGVNVNRYLGNDQSCGAHTDDDRMTKALSGDTLLRMGVIAVTIVSLSLGSPMRFEIMSVNKRKRFIQSGHLHDLVVDNRVAHCELGHGDLLTMEGYFQKVYLHRVKKANAPTTCRYNLTIRFLLEHSCHRESISPP